MIGVPCAFNLRIIGASFGIPGLLITSSAFRMRDSVCLPSSHSMPRSFSMFLYESLIVDMSETKVSKPCFFARTAAPAPLSPAPSMTILLAIIFVYLIFNVIIVIAASTMVTIQKRTVIFDSWNTLLGFMNR
ncbi:unknown [Phocaeicola dorei CAG:222]|nr:unknown [Phocaeicola dorei CAG:222]